MRIALTGVRGQLGQAIAATLGAQGHEIIGLGHDQLELGNPAAIEQIAATKAELVIHPAAYTNVDGCARDPELAYRINGLGTQYVALACQKLGAPLVYISTNEVFAGDADRPYAEYAPTSPVNAYGRSKLAGELVVRELLREFYIVRVAWLFGGERNFVRTIARLAAEPPAGGLRMVADEIGSPTYTYDVAEGLGTLIASGVFGTYHFVNAGQCSRYEFAREIMDQSGFSHVPLTPIRLADYQRASSPPPYTPLANLAGANLGITFRDWQTAVAAFLARL